MPVRAGPAEHAGKAGVLVRQGGHFAADLHFAQAVGQVQLLHPDLLRHHRVEAVGALQAQLSQHPTALLPGGGNIAAHGYASSAAQTCP